MNQKFQATMKFLMFQTENLKFRNSKSQAAMEFLMTYGWALIVILIVLAGLAYFGVLNIEQFMPEKIDMPPGLVAQKFFMTTEDNALTIYLANGVGAPITNLQMSIPCQNGSLSSTIASLPEGKTDKIKIYCQMPEGSRLKGNINITYTTREMQKTFSRRFTGFASVYVQKNNCPTTMAGAGTVGNPYQICDCGDLQDMNLSLAANYIVIRDIDCKFDTQHPLGTLYNSRNGFKPVGNNTASYQFTGSFDGQRHIISNLFTNRNTNYNGLFGYVTNSISNIGLTNVNITGSTYTAGLVGRQLSGVIANSSSSGNVIGTSHSVGGLVGYQEAGTIYSSSASGSVRGPDYSLGGFIGYSAGTIYNSSSSSSVTSTDPSDSYAGGFAGQIDNRVYNSYSTGSITGTKYTGGFVGYLASAARINNSFSTVSVTGTTTEIGGFVGSGISLSPNILYSYSVGAVPAASSKGFGTGNGFSLFWDTQTSDQLADACGALGKTTAEMKTASTFIVTGGWDTNIWNIVDGSYPTLKWQG